MLRTMRHPLRAITCCVVVMHAAALTLVLTAPAKTVRIGSAGKQHARTMQTRFLTQARVPAPSPLPTPLPTLAQAAPEAEAARPQPLRPEPTIAAPATDLVVADNNTSAVMPLEMPAAESADPGDQYLPRPQLTSPPRVSGPVIVPFPNEVTTPGRYATTLALFIDESGVVRRVLVDGPSLPKQMEDAARDTFLQTHFRPGELEGQQVKSLIRVEVVFDNTPMASNEGARSM
jgi:hypothetical protein